MENILRIKGGYIITMDSKMNVYKDYTLVISGNTIVDILPNDTVESKYADVEVLTAEDKVILPGLINSHLHTNLVRGFGDGKPLYQWHEEIAEAAGMTITPEEAYLGALVGYAEAIKSGTTTILALEKFSEKCYQAAQETGIRARLTPYILDFEDCIDTIELNLVYVQKTAAPEERVRFWFGFDSFREASPKMIREIVALAKKYKTGLHTHSNESVDDLLLCRKQHQKDPIVYLHELGVLSERTVLAHCVHLSEDERALMQQTGTKIAHCPTSNMKLADGAAPVVEYISRGIKVGLGTDGALTNNNYDLFEEMKFAVLLQRIIQKRADALTAPEILKMATIGGAEVLGLSKEVGSLEKGKKADICIMDLRKFHCLPFDPEEGSILISHLVFSANGADVDTVIINGKIVMANRILQTIDEQKLLFDANKAGKYLIARLKLKGINFK